MTYQTLNSKEPAVAQPPRVVLMAIGLVWVGLVIIFAINGLFDVPASDPALPTLIAIFLPVLVFAGAVIASGSFRELILSIDPVLLTEFQAWRILGGMFLVVMAFGHLPGVFAWPAGLGDVAVGIAAPFMAYRLRKSPGFLVSARYRIFVFFGLADFAVAITLGILSRNSIDGLVGSVTSSAMGQMPLVLIPTFIVPAFIILHLIVLIQISDQKIANPSI